MADRTDATANVDEPEHPHGEVDETVPIGPTALAERRPGPDVTRAVALIGVVVMNYHGYLVLRGSGDIGDGWAAELFDPFRGPLSTRFAATFVLVAGIGVALIAGRAAGDRDRVRELRWVLVRRGLVLYGAGLLLDMVWRGTILTYYGALFALAAVMVTLRTGWIVAVGALAAVAGAAIRWWRYEQELDGRDVSWLTAPPGGSVRGVVFDVFVNGTHPLLPWLAFFCAGIVVGRSLATPWWRPVAAGVGFVLFAVALMANAAAGTDDRLLVLLSLDPPERGLAYTASALGTALLAYVVVSWLAERYEHTRLVDALRRAGQLSLSLYVAHALVFNLVVDWLGWIGPTGLDTALVFSAVFWTVGIVAAVAWSHRFGRGPAERVYRALTR